jgi:hypothetical protein
MTTIDYTHLDEAFALALKLTPRDRARLIARLAEALVFETPLQTPSGSFTLPVLQHGTWVDDLPLNRGELYDDDQRC